MTMFAWFKVVAAFVPVIFELARVAQGSELPGDQKRAAVMTSLQDTFTALQATGSIKEIRDMEWTSLAGTIEKIVTVVVMLAKGLGALR